MEKLLKIRDYVPSDHPAIIEITKHIWGGNDYLPDRIHEYLADDKSFPIVIEDETSKVVSVANTRLISDNIAWLEAMRTHEDARGKGYGTHLTRGQLDKARENGAERAWLFTHWQNQATRRITEKLGFKQIGLYSLWGWSRKDMEEYAPDSDAQVDRDGKLIKFKYILNHVSDIVVKLATKWRIAESIEDIGIILEKVRSNSFDTNILGEFYSYPLDSYDVMKWFNDGKIFINNSTNSVMTIMESKEVDDMIIAGITTDNEGGITSGIVFLKSITKSEKVEFFFSSQINHPLFSIESHQFKLFEYVF